MKKLLFKGFIILVFIFIIYIIIIFGSNYFIDKQNKVVQNYSAQNVYEETYPVSNYVSETTETSNLYKNAVIKSMLSYEDILDKSIVSQALVLVNNFFIDTNNYAKDLESLQYIESKPLKMNEVYDDITHNYEVVLTSENIQEIKINLAIMQGINYGVVISLIDSDGYIDEEKAKALSDDSTAELLAYLIVEKTQEIGGTNMEPDDASKYYYGTSIERLAGDISYHAIVAYILLNYDLENKELVYQKVQNINISKEDNEGMYLNRKF